MLEYGAYSSRNLRIAGAPLTRSSALQHKATRMVMTYFNFLIDHGDGHNLLPNVL